MRIASLAVIFKSSSFFGTGGQGQGHKKRYSNRSYSLHEKYSIPEKLIMDLFQ